MSNLESISQLMPDEKGIYRSAVGLPISYPQSGNSRTFLLEDSSYWFRHRNNCITSVIKAFPPGGPIIDVGGGNGYVTRAILDAGFDAILLEPGPEGAMNGKVARRIPTVICSTFQKANFKRESLSAIGCFDVIEHIENDREFIKHSHQLLKPDGLLYATVPAHKYLWSRSDVTAQHYRRYNRSMLEQLLCNQFEILYFSYFFRPLAIPIFIFRALPFLLRRNGSKNVFSTSTEHGSNKGISVDLLNWRLNKELKKIKNSTSIRFGASCLFVAKKLN